MAEEAIMTDMGVAAPTGGGALLERYVFGVEEPVLLADLRREAWKRYEAAPMPTRRSEEWRYTDLSGLDPERYVPIAPGERRLSAEDDLPAAVREALRSDRERSGVLVQHNGEIEHLRLDESLATRGVVYAPIRELAESNPDLLGEFLYRSETAEAEEKLWSLHIAALSGGYALYVPRGVKLEHPLHAFHFVDRDEAIVSTHTLVIAEPGAEIVVIDEYISPDLEAGSLSLNGVEIFGSESATVRYVALQRYGSGMMHFSMQHANTGRDSYLSGFNVTLGGDLARADVTSHLAGPGAESEMLALWFGDGTQHIDHQTLQLHEAPSARSDLLYKGALTGSATSVFRGLIRVNEGAQLTDAYQTNRNLLLSPDAHAVTLPNLEIEADDVRCSHGATVGQVDETQLFYLMSRGLDRQQAEHLLVLGFFDEVLGRMSAEGVRERVRNAIEQKIGL